MANGTRIIWQDPEQGVRLVCKIWEDGAPPSYAAQIWDAWWRWAEPHEDHRVLMAVARWLDPHSRDREGDRS